MEINTENFLILRKKINKLNSHKLFRNGNNFSQEELKIFMEYHVFAVWDFMCIIKELQRHVCPSGYPWIPNQYSTNGIAHLVNEIVLSEESDRDDKGTYFSHFDLYIKAMKDIGANTNSIFKFIDAKNKNTDLSYKNLNCIDTPLESIDFVDNTFECLKTNKLSNVAAIFAYGRETTIPDMFTNILNKLDDNNYLFSNFKLYINRHIEIDSSRHGPLSLQLFEYSYENSQEIYNEAIDYAIKSIDKRIILWDGVLSKIIKLRQ